MEKFDSRVEKGILVGYSSTRKAYKCYNIRLNKFVESINVTIDEIGRLESKEEKAKCKLHGRHNDYYWVEVRKREEKTE